MILIDLTPTTATAAPIHKLQVKKKSGLPIQPVPNDSNDEKSSQTKQDFLISKHKNIKISKSMCPLLTNCIKLMYVEEGPLENTTVYFVLEKKK